MMKVKLARFLVLGVLLLGVGGSTVFGQAFSKYGLTNPEGDTVFHGIDNSKNTKIYAGKKWLIKVTSISFSESIPSNNPGIKFSPMKKNGNIYSLCGGNYFWTKTTQSGYTPIEWNSGAGAVGDYYLGARLDNRLTTCSANVAGDWNAN